MKKLYFAIFITTFLFSTKTYSYDTLRVNIGVALTALKSFNSFDYSSVPQISYSPQVGAVFNFFQRKKFNLGIGYNFNYHDFSAIRADFDLQRYFRFTEYRTFRNDLYLITDIKLIKHLVLSPFIGTQIISNKFLKGEVINREAMPEEPNLNAKDFHFNTVINPTYGFELSIINMNLIIDRVGFRINSFHKENFGIGTSNTVQHITTAMFISKHF